VTQAKLEAYSKAWNSWLVKLDSASNQVGENHVGTLAIAGGGDRSPVGCAFTVLHTVLRNRAKALVGAEAFLVDDDGTEYFSPPWNTAAEAFLCAIMGLGAPHLVSAAEAQTLISPWRSVYESKA
jgi:hypothetical protein